MASKSPGPDALTAILRQWAEGDKETLDWLVPLLYDELRQVAHAQVVGNHSGQKWELLRDDHQWRSLRQRHRFQDHP
jgi:hypothetical protein